MRGLSETLFKITNDGNAILHVNSTAIIGGTDHFFITDGYGFFSLVPGQSRNLRVKFSPISSGRKMAVLRLLCNDPDDLQIDLSLTGTGKTSTTPAIPLLLLYD